MPQPVTLNIRDQVYAAIIDRMRQIRSANGYNNDVEVSNTWREIDRNGNPFLTVIAGPDAIPLVDVSQVAEVDSVFFITGRLFVDTAKDDLYEMRPLNSLVQDVRNALSSGVEEMNSEISPPDGGTKFNGMYLLGSMQTDEGELKENGEMQFTQTVVVKYKNGKEW